MPWNQVMSKWGKGTLKSGSGGKVQGQKQAVAIMLSEKRAAKGGKSEYAAKKVRKPVAGGMKLSSLLRPK
jgi:hypothetical protein